MKICGLGLGIYYKKVKFLCFLWTKGEKCDTLDLSYFWEEFKDMRQIKGFICGVIFAAGLMAIPAVADTVEKSITVLTDYVTVQVDGQTKDVRNFVSDGTTYIALRDVANVFGYQVGWDDATRVASITTGKTAAADETAMEVNGEKISQNTISRQVQRPKKLQLLQSRNLQLRRL